MDQNMAQVGHNDTTLRDNNVGRDFNVTLVQNTTQERENIPGKLYNVPLNQDAIIGRERETEELFDVFFNKREEGKAKQKVCITGMAGIGKTALALHCANKWLLDKKIKYIAMFNAQTTTTFAACVNEFARTLDLVVQKLSIASNLRKIFDKLEDTLIVYDNLDSTSFDILKKYLPDSTYRHIYVLATSQLTDVDAFFYCYALELLNEDNSVRLVQSIIKSQQYDEKNLKNLVNMLEYLPLAIQLAAAFIEMKLRENKNYSIQDYIGHYSELIKQPFPKNFKENYERSAYAALKININKIESEEFSTECKTILYSMAYLNPSEINIDIYNDDYLEEKLRKITVILKSYSIVNEFEKVNVKYLSIHRLFQTVCRELDIKEDGLRLALRAMLGSYYYHVHVDYLYPYLNFSHYLGYMCTVPFRRFFGKPSGKPIKICCSLVATACALSSFSPPVSQQMYEHLLEQTNIQIMHHKNQTVSHEQLINFANFSEYEPSLKYLINFQNQNGDTVAHRAAKYKHIRFLYTLVESGANADLKNINGKTYLDILSEKIVDTTYSFGTYKCIFQGIVLKSSIQQTQMFVYWKKLSSIEDCFRFITALEYHCLQENNRKMEELITYIDLNISALHLFTQVMVSETISIEKLLILTNQVNTTVPDNFPEGVFKLISLILDSLELAYPKCYRLLLYRSLWDNRPRYTVLQNNRNAEDTIYVDQSFWNFFQVFNIVKYRTIRENISNHRTEGGEGILNKSLISYLLNSNDYLVQTIVLYRTLFISNNLKNVYENVIEDTITTKIERFDFLGLSYYFMNHFGIIHIRQYYLHRYKNSEYIAELINNLREDTLDVPVIESWPTLWFAVCDNRRNSWRVVQMLIRLGADVTEEVNGICALNLAEILNHKNTGLFLRGVIKSYSKAAHTLVEEYSLCKNRERELALHINSAIHLDFFYWNTQRRRDTLLFILTFVIYIVGTGCTIPFLFVLLLYNVLINDICEYNEMREVGFYHVFKDFYHSFEHA